MTIAPPVRYSDDIETIRPDEQETIDSLNQSFDKILETTAEDYGHAVRAVHAKGHAVLKGIFTVDEGLPPELAQGLFAQGGTYVASARISTNPGDILDDAIALPRGLAIKVEGVPGERLPRAEGTSQDFVMVNAPAFIAPSADKFTANLKTLAATTDKAEGAKIALSKVLQAINGALSKVGLGSATLATLGGAPQVHPLGETYFSAVPFRYGDHIAKFRLRPLVPALTQLADQTVDTKDRPNAIREDVRADMARIVGEWAFEVQLARDLDKQPVEDASAEWDEKEAPFVQVATLRIGAQDSWDAGVVREVDEEMRFSPWTGLAAHRPLGNINRARRDTYLHSARFRERVNHCPIREP